MQCDSSPADKFLIADETECYLDGNSLGRLPLETEKRLQTLVREEWGTELIGGWNSGWIDLPKRIGGQIAGLIGSQPHETIVADSTSVNLFKLATAALRRQAPRGKIVTEASNFPSDLYILRSAADAAGVPHGRGGGLKPELVMVGEPGDVCIPTEQVLNAIDEDTALVCMSHVAFRSGQLQDMRRICAAAQAHGALTLWDLSHSVGAVPIELNDCGADLAVGCTYKYLCGGPGAPAFLFVRESLQAELTNPIAGWFSHRSPFAFQSDYEPVDSIDRFLTGTPPVLSLAAIEHGVELVARAGMQHLRAVSVAMSTRLLEHFDGSLRELGFELRSPRDPAERGSHVSLGHPEARRITANLIDRHKVVPDFRTPDNLRIGIAPLYNTTDDIDRAAEAIRQTVAEKQYESVVLPQAPVT